MKGIKFKARLEYPTQEDLAWVEGVVSELIISSGEEITESHGAPGEELITSRTPVVLECGKGELFIRKRYRKGRLAHYHVEVTGGGYL